MFLLSVLYYVAVYLSVFLSWLFPVVVCVVGVVGCQNSCPSTKWKCPPPALDEPNTLSNP